MRVLVDPEDRMKSYTQITPIYDPIPADRQGAKRHYGVHPYFTRRPFNVIRDYIRHYSRAGDRVLDPFGGSGVTAIEAFLESRVGIHNDIIRSRTSSRRVSLISRRETPVRTLRDSRRSATGVSNACCRYRR